MRHAITRIIAAIAAVLTITTFALAPAAGASARPPDCHPHNLGVTLTHPQGAAGLTGYTVEETNDGPAGCMIGRYPHFRLLLHRSGHYYRVDAVVTHGPTQFAPDPGPGMYRVDPGRSVTASIQFSSPGAAGSVRAVGLIVRDWRADWGLPAMFPGPADIWHAAITTTAWRPAVRH